MVYSDLTNSYYHLMHICHLVVLTNLEAIRVELKR